MDAEDIPNTRGAEKTSSPCPYDEASAFSKLTFWWLNPLFRAGYSRRLEPKDMYDVPREDEARSVETRLTQYWKKELEKHPGGGRTSLFYVILLAFRNNWVFPGLILLCADVVLLAQPYLIGQLINYFSSTSEITDTEAYLHGLILGVSSLIQVFTNTLYYFLMTKVGMRMRTAVAGLIYKKILALTSRSFANTTSGNIVNLLSTDIENLTSNMEYIHFLWDCPILMAVTAYILYRLVGLSCVFGLAVLLLLLPVEIITSHVFGKLRLKIGFLSDKRIHMMTEILSGIRVIKMYCWEKPFSKLISSLRNKEIRMLKASFVIKALNSSGVAVSTRLMALVIFVGHWLGGYLPLPLQTVFMTLGWLSVIRLFSDNLYEAIEAISVLASSLSRIQRFLTIDDSSSNQKPVTKVDHGDSDIAVNITSMSAIWDKNGDGALPPKDENIPMIEVKTFSLTNIHLVIKKGELLAVVGTIGSGKSSLISVLLEELPYSQGEITMCGSLSYCAQKPWVFSGTVRDNVLFGDHFDYSRYEAVIDVCALSKDISLMPHGDQTLVGERGLLLSGGQKARLTLASCKLFRDIVFFILNEVPSLDYDVRMLAFAVWAVYRKRDIYLLDDPLSAVDTEVGKHIFNKCVCELLRGTTRVLITHQLQYLKTADRIAIMSQGQILNVGSYEDFLSHGLDLSTLVTSSEKDGDLDDAVDKHDKDAALKLTETAEQVVEENRDAGSVGFDVYKRYFAAGKGIFFVPLTLLLFSVTQILYTYSDWLLAQWSDARFAVHHWNSTLNHTVYQYLPTDNITADVIVTADFIEQNQSSIERSWFTMVTEMRSYIVCDLVSYAAGTLACIFILQMTAVASNSLHNQMFKFILGSKTRFFDINPVGRILNRFARDIGFVDNRSGYQLMYMLKMFFKFLSALVLTAIVSPWLLIPVIPLLILIVVIRQYAVQTTRDVRRIEAIARSPVYSHISETINGLQTVRAMKKEDQFYTDFVTYQNTHTSAWFIYRSSYRWFGFRTTFPLAAYTAIVNFVCIALGNTVPRSLLALAISYCSGMGEPFEWFIRLTAEFENLMTSTERVISYTKIEQERPATTCSPPQTTWPREGHIAFSDVSLRYSPKNEFILKHLKFDIKAKEKIGIVGRTGAGKSSLLAALFRMAEPEGSIVIDGVDITKIGLHQLRRKISAIPQDPVLFTGQLRFNMDPFDEFPDPMIWKALEQVQLKDKVAGSPGQLDMEVTESGANFSVGERQLICLARAVLRQNRIIVLDEATANVDNRTDELIQKTIREQFQESTVLTIAHRLHTVIDYDRILVMDEGMVREFDIPYLLLKNKDGFLCNLVHQMGPQHEEHLMSLAKGAMKSTDV